MRIYQAAIGLSLLLSACSTVSSRRPSSGERAPSPLLEQNHPVDWWFVFKLNSAAFPACADSATRTCAFGGEVQPYKDFGQQYIYASSESSKLVAGGGCAGDTGKDPIGATFDQIFQSSLYYVVWNDQFYDDPKIDGCSKECGSPWGHSKGVVAWNEAGEGVVMQVSTPSWPASGSAKFPRKTDGNTLGCVKDDDVEVSQHFFALKLDKGDLVKLLTALKNSSVSTDVTNKQVVNNGGPDDVQKLVAGLGQLSDSTKISLEELSSGVKLLSKPSNLHVPPWQMVSAVLGGVPLRTATWWASPAIPSTTPDTPIACWDDSLGKPGAVEIATVGNWDGKEIGLRGGEGPDFNHAKLGVSLPDSGSKHYAIFGDMNQQGNISGSNCRSSQNGRGGLFFILDDAELNAGITDLITGEAVAEGVREIGTDETPEREIKPEEFSHKKSASKQKPNREHP